METTGNGGPSDGNDKRWTHEIVEAVDVSYKNLKFQATALVAVTAVTLASLVGMARYDAPYYGYILASGTGVIFGFLVRRKRWQRDKESG